MVHLELLVLVDHKAELVYLDQMVRLDHQESEEGPELLGHKEFVEILVYLDLVVYLASLDQQV